MEIFNICNLNDDNLKELRNSEFSHHFKDIDDKDLIQVIINKINETEEKIGWETNIIILLEIITIYKNDKNEKIKRTTKLEQQKNISRIPKRVIERQNLKKFGKAAISNNGVTLTGDEMYMEMINEKSILNKNILDKKIRQINEIKENPGIKFSDRRKLKDYESTSYNITTPPKEPISKKYMNSNRHDNRHDNFKKFTIHISGFRSDFTRNEFLNLIPNNLKVSRVTLPCINNKCKGYGFIDVNSKDEMNKIIDFFDKKPYKHMILQANFKK